MPLGAHPPSIKNVNVPKFKYTLDDILDESSKFQNRMFISFPQFVYCSRDEVYFHKLSCLITSNGGTLHGQHTTVAMHHIHDITKPLMTYVLAALWCHVVRTFSSKKTYLKVSSVKCRPFCLGQGWGEYSTYEYEYWKISTRVVLEYNVFNIFMFIILDKTSTRVVLAPALVSASMC